MFTAHPTEASRRSVLELLRKIAELVATREDPRRRPRTTPRAERRLAELVDLLWQTDELRVVRPEPKDEARTAIYYLQTLATEVVPGPAGGARPRAGRRSASSCRPTPGRCGSAPGPAATATATPTSPRRSPSTCSALQHDFGLRVLIAEVEDLLTEMSPRPGWSTVTDELQASLERDAEALPITYDGDLPAQRRGALPAEAELRPGPAGAHPRPAGRRHRRTSPAATTSGSTS